MIESVKNIVTNAPLEQVWKYLRFFRHVPSVCERIRKLHEIGDRKFDSDIKKQALQISYCIRQAEEYFDAASQVGNATKPNLLYYGAVNLSQAVVLLKNEGTFSLDFRRRQAKHNHHGLELVRGKVEGAEFRGGVERFLECIECAVFEKPDGTHWGHFPLFYGSLVPTAYSIHQRTHEVGVPGFLEMDFAQNSADIRPINALTTKTFNVGILVRTLPDIYYALQEFGMSAQLCPGNAEAHVRHEFEPVALNAINDEYVGQHAANRKLKNSKLTMDFFFDAIFEDSKKQLLDFYAKTNPNLQIAANYTSNLHLKLTVEGDDTGYRTGYLPDIVEDIGGKKFHILQPGEYIPEPANFLILLFCFGMLSRYYPDIWMRALDADVHISEFVDSLLRICIVKFPTLILDQLTGVKHNIRIT